LIVRGIVVVGLFASKRAAAFGAGLALLLGAAPASAEVVDLFGSTPSSPAIEILVAGAGAGSSALPESGSASAYAGDQSDAAASSSPVPEPGAWALIILGFLGLGLGAYRKRKPRLASLVD